MALETVQQLRTTLGFTAPPVSPVVAVDQDGNRFVINSVTFHDEDPNWTSVDIELIPDS